jgi:hypothetical protein
MSKILVSLLTIAFAATISVGATAAVFTDEDSVVGNTIATGTLSMTINEGVNKPISVSNWKPGDSIEGWFDAFNNGSLDAEYWFYAQKTGGDNALGDQLMIQLRDGGFTGTCDGPVIYNGKLKDLAGFANKTKTSDNNVHAASTAGADNIRAGWTQRICQKVWLPESADNSAMGKSFTFNEVVYATQDDD